MTKFINKTEVDRARGRKTALMVGSILLLIAAWNFHRSREALAAVLVSAGGALLFTGLLLPSLAKRFHILWMQVSTGIGFVNSRILLSLIFYGIFTPYGLAMRLFGRDPLKRRSAPRDSYWIPRQNTRQSKERFERLF